MSQIKLIAEHIPEDPNGPMNTKAHELTLCVIYTPWDDLEEDTKSELVTSEDIIENAIKVVRARLEEILPDDHGCSLVMVERAGQAHKMENIKTLMSE